MTVETLTPISGMPSSHRQVVLPSFLTGSFNSQDTANHDFKADGRGKGRLSVAINNAPNQQLTVTVYGQHVLGGDVGDVGTFSIGSFTVAAGGGSATKGYETINDPFPFYLIRCAYGVAPTDDPAKTCTVYIDFESA